MKQKDFKFTRSTIINSKIFAIRWLYKNKYNFNPVINKIFRGDMFTLDINNYYNILNNIEFIYNDIDCHWAETDGNKMWINIWNDDNRWSQELLNYTVTHECIHGLIKRNGKYYTTEYKEHIIMGHIDTKLI
jgi:hypothetical protein